MAKPWWLDDQDNAQPPAQNDPYGTGPGTADVTGSTYDDAYQAPYDPPGGAGDRFDTGVHDDAYQAPYDPPGGARDRFDTGVHDDAPSAPKDPGGAWDDFPTNPGHENN